MLFPRNTSGLSPVREMHLNKTLYLIFMSLLMAISSLTAQNRERSEHWHKRNAQFEAALDSLDQVDNVFLGNSITEGFDLEQYFPGREVANRGIVADHLDGLLERLENSAVGLKPDKLFLMIGVNDIGDRRSDDYLKKMYITLIDTLMQSLPETEIYLHSLLPTSPRWKNCPPEQIKRINGFLAHLALEKGINYVNLYPYFLGDMERIDPSLAKDGIHPNARGYQIWADKIRHHLK